MRMVFGVLLAVLAASPALAGSDKQALAGEWRQACSAEATDTRLVVEFALTGGTVMVDDGTEASGTARFAELEKLGKLSVSGGALVWNGETFKRCRAPADRSAIKLTKAQIAEISAAMPPRYPTFVDARTKGGCGALDHQYLTIDLVNPLGASMGRWNSVHLGEMLAEGKKSPVALDEVANWTIDKAEAVPGGYRLTLTELIPPNGARGDTTTITLSVGKNDKAAVAEWKRAYLRCTEPMAPAH